MNEILGKFGGAARLRNAVTEFETLREMNMRNKKGNVGIAPHKASDINKLQVLLYTNPHK
jgi:hypothetical protein